MIDFEIVRNPPTDVWHRLVDLVYEHEGWVLSYDDYAVWLKGFGDNGFVFFAAIAKETKELIGSVCLAEVKPHDGYPGIQTFGMYFMLPQYRGEGIGSQLFNALMTESRKRGGNAALNGVQKMSPKYASRFGFDKISSWHPKPYTVQMKDVDPDRFRQDSRLSIVAPKEVDMQKIFRYDKKTVGASREEYVKAILQHKGSTNKVALINDEVVGLINVRECVDKQLYFGPFFADNEGIARTLLREVLNAVPNLRSFKAVHFNVPTTNAKAMKVIGELCGGAMQPHDHMIAQFSDYVIPTNGDVIYATTEYAMSYA